MLDLKAINATLSQLEEERGVPKNAVIEAIEFALAAAYKKDYGKKGQIIRAKFDLETGKTVFSQVKIVVDESMLRHEEDKEQEVKKEVNKSKFNFSTEKDIESDGLVYFNPEHHILIEDAKIIKKDAKLEEELIFELESKYDYGRIAAQTAKQVIIQKIREAEKVGIIQDFGQKQGDIINGTVQRTERGNIFVDLGKATGILHREEQIFSEKFKQNERIRVYLYLVEDTPRGINLKLSRSHPKFLEKLFEIEAPEIASGVVEIKAIAREAGSRSKIAVFSNDEQIDPVGACVGQRGVRVTTVMSELGGEKIDIIEWSNNMEQFIEDALSPAKITSIEIDEEAKKAIVEVQEDQLSLAIGKGGQNVRLAAKLTGWNIDIQKIDEQPTTEDGEEIENKKGTTENEDKETEVAVKKKDEKKSEKNSKEKK